MFEFIKYRKGKVVRMTVWDGFTGKVKILENHFNKWFIEIVDVTMCYPQQVQLAPGTRLWIHHKELYKNPNLYQVLKNKIRTRRYLYNINPDLIPF